MRKLRSVHCFPVTWATGPCLRPSDLEGLKFANFQHGPEARVTTKPPEIRSSDLSLCRRADRSTSTNAKTDLLRKNINVNP
jgi:hypothetical protein